MASTAIHTLIGLFTCIGPYLADYNETHVFNPNWTPHAKFHNGQTMSMGACLGLATLWYTWLGTPRPKGVGGVREWVEAERIRRGVVAVLANMYWVTQLSGFLYPGTLGTDPEFGDGNPQIPLCIGVFTLSAIAYVLEGRRIETVARKMEKGL